MHPFPLLMFVNNDREYGFCATLYDYIIVYNVTYTPYIYGGINRVGGLTHLTSTTV